MQRPRHLTVSSLSLVIYVNKSLCLDLCLGLLLKHIRTTMRLITIPTMIVSRNMVIGAEIFLCLRRLVIYVNKSRSFRPFQGQEMSAQMHR